MPFDPTTTLPIFESNLAAASMLGIGATNIAIGLSNGLAAFVTAGVTVTTIDVGTAGIGAGLGFCIATPASFAPLFESSFIAEGLTGPFATPLATGLAESFSTIFSSSVATTVHTSVGVGVGSGTLISTPSLPFILPALESASITGTGGAKLANAISNALEASLSTVIVEVIIAGSPSISPSGGVGTGKLI
jgi:hypothetical protein